MGDRRTMGFRHRFEGHTPRLCLRSLHAAEPAGSSTSTQAQVNPWHTGQRQRQGQGRGIRRGARSRGVIPSIRPIASAHGTCEGFDILPPRRDQHLRRSLLAVTPSTALTTVESCAACHKDRGQSLVLDDGLSHCYAHPQDHMRSP
jgi:hypothetical protein